MLHLPVYRWGEPYRSLEVEPLTHFATGQAVAEMSQANGGLVERDMRHAARARQSLRGFRAGDLLGKLKHAADLFLNAELPLGDSSVSPADYVRLQSATTGLPENLCRFNMAKVHLVLDQLDRVLHSLTRGLDLDIFARGYSSNGADAPLSYLAQSPVLGMVLPNNSPGVHTLWLPVLALRVGLVQKPGSQEPWTPYRLAHAFFQAGIPRQAISLYPGKHDVGAAVLASCGRSLVFGGQNTVEQYKADPRIQVHGPGFSKIIFDDDAADAWENHIDMMVESVASNSGRSCINCSSIWTPRHGRAIAEALAERLGPIEPVPPEHPEAALAAFTSPALAEAIDNEIQRDAQEAGVSDYTARFGTRLVKHERHSYLRPVVLFSESPEPAACRREYLFPCVTVVECPAEKIPESIGPTLVCTVLTKDSRLRESLLESTLIDRLNFGPIPTTKLNWLQPHEGNIIDFLFRPRAYQEQLL
jgi:Aldehyde dehydrogenase family